MKMRGGGGGSRKPEVLLEENEGGRGSGVVSPKGKQKELEVFADVPLPLLLTFVHLL